MVSEENPDVEMTEEPVSIPTLSEVPWEHWTDDGEAKFLAAFAHLIKSDKQEGLENAVNGFSKAVNDLILKGIHGPLTPEQVTSVINRVIFWNLDIPSVVVDVLSVIEMDSSSLETESKKNFYQLCKAIAKIIPVKLFKERYEMEPLTELDILPSKNFPSKFIKVKTRLYYKQNKFNLLREETEGFSKLMVCLFNQRITDDGGMNLEDSKNLILSLCGWFSLDPGRVLDIILDIFECNISSHNFFVPLVREFVKNSEMLFEVLMFRYSLYFKDGITPSSLHSVVAHFINNDMLSFEEIYKELEPSEEDMYAEIEKKYKAQETKTVSLTKKASEEEPSEQEFEANQKFGLMEVLIGCGRWDLFLSVINDCNTEYFLQQQPIATATTSFIHYLIDPLYNKYSTLGPKIPKSKLQHYQNCKLKPVNTLKEFIDVVVPILEILGPSIQHDCSLIFKVLRLLISVKVKLNDIDETDLGDFNVIILKLIETSFLPALSHLESNCCVSEIIWDLLKLYPIAVRYCTYSNWKEYSSKCPTVLKRKSQTSYMIRNCLKKVSKENVKPMGRIMGKIAHHAPVELFEYVMYQIQMYDSLIIPTVESLKYVDSMAYDVLGFVLVEALRSDPGRKPKHDGNAPSPWFINTAVFCASIMKKYPIDITGILKYIVEELLNKNYIELVVLKEILQKMTGIEITDEMTDDQIDALGGGECLRGEAAYFVPLRSMKRSTNRLKDALMQEDILATTSIIIAQLKYNIVYEEEQDFHLKFLGKLYDECHDTLLQYGTFISGSTMEEYNFEFPNLETLVLDYHITHECAFFLCRNFLIHKAKLKAAITGNEKNYKSDTPQINGNLEDDLNDSEMKLEGSDKKRYSDTNDLHSKKACDVSESVPQPDCDTLSCISSEDLDEPLEEDSMFNAEENTDSHSVSEEDGCSEVKKTITINEVYNMEGCEETNFEWDAEDSNTWTQHNHDDETSSTNNKILEYRDEIEHSDYLEDEEDMVTSANVFDIPKIFNIPPDGEGCLIEPLCQDVPEENDNNESDSRIDMDDNMVEESSIIVLDDDHTNDDKVDKSKVDKESKSDEQEMKIEESVDNTEAIVDADDDDKDKSNSKGTSSKLVNILLDWVIPSVLNIQDATSFISEEISPYASAVFWTLTLYDIHAPVDLYDKEVNKLKAVLSNQDHSKDNSSKAKKEQEKVNLLIERLTYEKKRHVKHVKSVLKKLDETKNEWFAPQTHKNAKNELINVLLHSCILPRVLFSAMDAVYCAKFILTLHQLHIENFSTVLCYDRLLCDIKNLVAMCSENEASRFGRFLCAVLKDVMRFHSSQEIYNAECSNTPGFITKFRSNSEHADLSDQVHYENYRHLCHKWHYKITKALLCLLDSKEYILIRNTIIVLKKILPQFPVIMKLAQCIEKKIGKIKQEEKDVRQDLHTLATSYWGHLKSRMPNMIDEGKFHLIDNYDNKESEKDSKDKNKKEEKSDKDKEDSSREDDKYAEKEEEEEFPLSKSDNESSSKKSSTKKDKVDEGSKEESSKSKLAERRSARSSSRVSTRGKRPHSETTKKAENSRSSEDTRKTARKKHKSRSKSIESEQNNKKEIIKKPKAKREYASPEPKKSRKKEKERKASSKSKNHHESPEPSPDRKHKPQQKAKRN